MKRSYLERHSGFPVYEILTFIAEDLRNSRTKAQRLELAQALERLVTPVLNLERPPQGKRGRRDKFWTWRDAALVNALVKYRGCKQHDAVGAVVRMRHYPNKVTARERIERYLRAERARARRGAVRIINYSYNPQERERAAALL